MNNPGRSILHQALQGNLVPQDEPAGVLLERRRQERESSNIHAGMDGSVRRRTSGKAKGSIITKQRKEIAMSATITVEEAQAKLKEIIHQLSPGEELVITENQQPVAKLVSERPKPSKPRPGPGLCRGAIVYMAPDFDAPLDDMKEYME